MSEYPYEGKIHSKDRVDYKTVFSSDGVKIGGISIFGFFYCQIWNSRPGDKIWNSQTRDRENNRQVIYS